MATLTYRTGDVTNPERIHGCPPEGSGVTTCCERTPFELPRTDRLTNDADAVTCMHADATKIIIPHIVNDRGAWGAGFVLALSSMWPEPEQYYRNAFTMGGGMRLGEIDVIGVGGCILVANMCAQHGTGNSRLEMLARDGAWHNDSPELAGFDKIGVGRNRPPIRYGALSDAMKRVATFSRADGKVWASIHAPRFGAGLAGGHWPTIEALIFEHWVDAGIDVTIYDLE